MPVHVINHSSRWPLNLVAKVKFMAKMFTWPSEAWGYTVDMKSEYSEHWSDKHTNIDATLFSFIHKWCCESMYLSVMSQVTFGYAISSPCSIDHTKGLAQQITKFCSTLLCNISFAFSPKIDFYKEGNVWTQEKVTKNPGTNYVDLQKPP